MKTIEEYHVHTKTVSKPNFLRILIVEQSKADNKATNNLTDEDRIIYTN